jgi:tetratricopeptide (TPR) repeat protein
MTKLGVNFGFVELLEGQPEKALTRNARLSTEWCRLTGVALAQHDLGHPRKSRDALDKLLAKHAEDAAYQIAEVYSRRGEKDRALDWLERAYAQRDPGPISVKCDPLLRSLQGDLRYTALLRKMNLPLD